jgi:hypothetical protein
MMPPIERDAGAGPLHPLDRIRNPVVVEFRAKISGSVNMEINSI